MSEQATLFKGTVRYEASMKQVINQIRELHTWLITWAHTLVGELIALSQPRADFRR